LDRNNMSAAHSGQHRFVKQGKHGLVRESSYPLLSVAEALDLVLREATRVRETTKQLQQRELGRAGGLVLAQDACATAPLPPFPASIMDGYAVVASDMPGTYPVVGDVRAGGVAEFEVKPGTVARITTGGAVPGGADAVIKVESTELLPERDAQRRELVRFNVGTAPGRCIRPVGSDIQAGQAVVPAGTRVGAAESGLLAAVGVKEVLVHPGPRVAVLSTGDELVEVHKEPGPGQIRDSNKSMLLEAIRQYSVAGCWETIDLGIARDDASELRSRLVRGLQEADVILTSGGVSMGELDLLQPLLEELGTIHFGRVLMKPGKPLTFATVSMPARDDGTSPQKEVLVFGLPGNPVSSLVTFQLFALPALRCLAGYSHPHLRHVSAKLCFQPELDPERPEYHRCKLVWNDSENCWDAHSTGNQISSRLLSMQSADALLCLPQAKGSLPTGTFVKALLIQPLN